MACDHRRHPHQTTNSLDSSTSQIERIWRTVLDECLGIEASEDELKLHAKISPYAFKAVAVPTLSQDEYVAWKAWAEKIVHHANMRQRSTQATVNYVAEIDLHLRTEMNRLPAR